MKVKHLILAAVVLMSALLFSGCNQCQEASDDCLNAYDQNRAVYDYGGGVPEECKN
ncbi:MAG: hypothetical protein JXB18_15230 [Sedimentisphaerales bacterium]|nr:hypothetical protein [Sedimentisphaerales bacterium]